MVRETNPAKMAKFDAIVAIPPTVPNRSALAGTPAKCNQPDDRMFIKAGNFPRNLF